jgi:hypothetical protein
LRPDDRARLVTSEDPGEVASLLRRLFEDPHDAARDVAEAA